MRQVPQNQIDISPNQLVYWSSDPFARSIPRQSRTPFHFHFGRSEAVEEIDEERGWIWGTNTSSKPGTSRQAIPGLGVGKYRPKNKRPPSHASKSAKKPYSQPEEIDETKEELLNDDNEVGETGEYAHGEEEPTGYSNFPSTGVSYLLSRLKESITARSRFSSQGSAATIPQKDSSRGRWNEVGQLVANEKNMARDSDFDDTKKKAGLQVRFDSHVSHQSGPALSEIALPELPAFTWDNNSSLKIAMTKRTRDSSLEVEITGCRSENIPGSQMPRREAFKLDSRPRSAKSTRLIKSKSKHLYPGGYIGRSPTKKLRKKESPQSQTLCSTIDS
ncbi:hypothetical protein PTTG_06927 [Puccinia triticina 1-1 BBBD Race 1]|uniref:Uncharacterized protein n=1 Tax=Puccinia triticina (isolate 1-1 / race 1 (BBBD)) TaxID=630390 RepID=A0A0C4F1F6_PUCT1|nr:hypothetical protein PTTG_06927 [Puccinia triticina 1-1 BBBD Race 1]